METRSIIEPLQPKTWQLDQDQSSAQGFLYSCNLCDETLVLSKLFINPRKVQLAFSNICPGCGFELDKTLKVQASTLPLGRRFLTNPVCKAPEQLIEPSESFEARLSRGSTLLRDVRSDLPSGTERLAGAIDECAARLAIVSDITALYCDPDVKEKREAFDLFSKNIRSLATLAEQRNMIIVVTNLQSRRQAMDDVLARTAHVSAILQDNGTHTQLTVTRHPFIPTGKTEIATLDNQTLTRYL